MKAVSFLFLILLFRAIAAEDHGNPPINDVCKDAVEIKHGLPPLKGSTIIDATFNEMPTCAGSAESQSGTKGVWYKFYGNGDWITASCSRGDVTTDFDTQISVYEGSCEDIECIEEEGNNNSCVGGLHSEHSWPSKTGTMYFIFVHGCNDATGDFELSLESLSLPDNRVISNTSNNTAQPETATTTTPSSEPSVSPIVDDSTILVYDSDATTTPQLSSSLSTEPSTSLEVSFQPRPINDNCRDAIELEIGPFVTGNTASATYDDMLNCTGFWSYCQGGDGVWYKFSGDGNGIFLSGFCGALYREGPNVAVYSGDCDSLTPVGRRTSYCESFTVPTQVDMLYYVYVWFDDDSAGEFELSLQSFLPRDNDICEEAIPTEIGDGPVQGYNTGGTNYENLPTCLPYCFSTMDDFIYPNGLWFTFQGDSHGVNVSLCNDKVSQDIYIAVYEGNCNILSCIGGTFYDCFIAWQTRVDTTYYVYVHGYWGLMYDEIFEFSIEPIRVSVETETEHNLLVAMNESFGGIWYDDIALNHCHWEGIVCDNNLESPRILTIQLSGRNLVGTIPSEIGSLSHLWELNLAYNGLTGTLPTEIGYLTNLNSLALNGNNLEGVLPTQIGMLRGLEYMDSGSNHFTGIPSEIGLLGSLRSLHLDNNDFKGTLLSELGNLTSLGVLHLYDNDFEGVLPRELWNLSSLYRLYLYNNDFTGSVPSELAFLTYLLDLSLYGNAFSGSIPSWIGTLSRLREVNLSENSLNETIPSELGMLSNLVTLDVSENSLTASIPSEFGMLVNLELINLRGNSLSQSIPSELGMLSNLRSANLAENLFTGRIPVGFGNFTSLGELVLNRNLLDGTLHIENLRGLIDLDVSQNRLSGLRIAQELPSIRTFDASNNSIVFEIASNFFDLFQNAQNIILANNLIHGQLPNDVNFRLLNLMRLDLDGNCLSGELPVTYDIAMPQLEELWLSYGGEKCRVDPGRQSSGFYSFDRSNAESSGYCFRREQCWVEVEATFNVQSTYCCGNEPAICTDYSDEFWHDTECHYRLYRVGLWGSLPPALSLLSNLRVLHLANNLLTGEIPANLGNGLSRMLDFNITNNRLQGRIPTAIASIGSSSEVTPTISLSGNRFNGSLLAPLQLCLLKEKFDLYHENETWCPRERNILYHFFDASNGQEWTNSSRWVDEYDSHCEWHGITCHENSFWVKRISLGNNGLSGRITTQIGGLLSLEKLDVSDNDLKGSIPRALSGLLALSDVRMSYNSLTGAAPELRHLTNLEVLRLHSNRLQGELHIEPQNNFSAIADCGSPSEFKEPLRCPRCTFCCNYLGECDENRNDNTPSLLFGECGEEFTDPVLGLHINGCSIQEGAVFILYIIVACVMTCLLSFVSNKMCKMLTCINWQEEINLGVFMGENSVHAFILSSSYSGWFIALAVWIFQIYVYFLFVDASQKNLSDETDWLYRYRCARNAGDEETCENTTSVTPIGEILGIAIMVMNLMKDLMCGLKLIWIVPRRTEPIQKGMRCLIGATLLFTVSSFAIYSSVVYNQATATRDTDFIYNSVVLIFLNSLDEWCFAAVRVICPTWLKSILKEIEINPENTARQTIENIQRENEDAKEEYERIKEKNDDLVKEIEEIKEEHKGEKEEMKKEIEEIREESKESKRENEHMKKELEELKRQISFICGVEMQSLPGKHRENLQSSEGSWHKLV